MTKDKKYTDNDFNDWCVFIEMVFIKNGDFRKEAFSGIPISSAYLVKCFSTRYKQRVIDELINFGVLRKLSDFYVVGQGVCKKYALKEKAKIFYHELKKKVKSKDFRGWRSKKRIKKFLNETYEDSLNYYEFHPSDSRIHSPWVTLPRETRHNYITRDGKFLVCDLDLKTAHWSMLCQFAYETLEEYPNSEIRADYYNLVYAIKKDIYTYFIEKAGLDVSRSDIKPTMCSLINTSRSNLPIRNNKLPFKKELFSVLQKEFPLITEWILDCNEGDQFLGHLFNMNYEGKIIVSLIRNLQKYKEFDDTELQPVFDGIEFFQNYKFTDQQKDVLEKEMQNILKPYKHLKMEYELIK